MVLAAGRGERMRPLTYRIAKPAIPVLNRPLLGYALAMLRRAGVTKVAVNLHHLPETVTPVIDRWTPDGMEVVAFREETLLGTAGGVKNAERVLAGDGPFFLSNGDFLLDVDPAAVLKTHRRARAAATLVLVPFQEHMGYQPVEVVEGRVVRIAGHPEHDGPEPERYIFAGLHVVEPEVLERIPPGEEFAINRQVYPALIADGRTVAAHVVDGAWLEFGTPGEYLRRTLRLLSPAFQDLLDRVGVRTEGEGDQRMLIGRDVSISESAVLRDGMVVGDDVSIGRDVKLRRSLIWDGAKIGYHSDLSDSIIGKDVILPPNSVFHHRIVLSRADDIPPDANGERQGDLIFFRL
jgi:NDP-sugar pyrophosphorylase family protein